MARFTFQPMMLTLPDWRPRVRAELRAGTVALASFLLVFAALQLATTAFLQHGAGRPVWPVTLATVLASLLFATVLVGIAARRLTVAAQAAALIIVLCFAVVIRPFNVQFALDGGDSATDIASAMVLAAGLPLIAAAATMVMLARRTVVPGLLGALVALFLFPVLVEPSVTSAAQVRLLGVGLIMLVPLVGLSLMAPAVETDQELAAPGAAAEIHHAARWWNAAICIVLAAVVAALLMSVTSVITAELAVAPVLWVLPLAVVLAVALLERSGKFLVGDETVEARQGVGANGYALGISALGLLVAPSWSVVIALIGLALGTQACLQSIAARTPRADRDLQFFGVVIAGAICGILLTSMPVARPFGAQGDVIFWLVAASLAVPGVLLRKQDALDAKRLGGLICLTGAMLLAVTMAAETGGTRVAFVAFQLGVVGAVVTLLATRHWPERRAVAMLAMALVTLGLPEPFHVVSRVRGDNGTIGVVDLPAAQQRHLMLGTRTIGWRPWGRPRETGIAPASVPFDIAVPGGDIVARAFEISRGRKTAAADDGPPNAPARILAGIIGVGTGALACQARAGDAFRLYEVDRKIAAIASDPKMFGALAACAPQAPLLVGPLRRTLAREPDEVFDLLVLDLAAFQGVPLSALTVEAFKLYMSKLADDGLLAVVLPRGKMDSAGAVASSLAQLAGVQAARIMQRTPAGDTEPTQGQVILVARSSRVLDSVLTWSDAEGLPRSTIRPWTDGYANVMAAIVRRYMP